jgi:hypothetical protein
MSYKPGDVVYLSLPTQNSTGAATNADSTPAVIVRRNGVTDATVTPTVSNAATGLYNVSFTIPVGYAAGDTVAALAQVTMGGVTGPYTAIWRQQLDTARVSEVHSRLGVAGAGLTALGDTRIANLDTTVSSRSTFAGGAVASVTAPVTLPATAALEATVQSVKAKTDLLPSDPADASDIAGAFSTVNTTLAAIAAYIDTEVAAIKAKTDALPSDPADASEIAASFTAIAASLATLSGYVDTEVAAIKAKTDNLPASPAAVGSAMTLETAERTAIRTEIDANSTQFKRLLGLNQENAVFDDTTYADGKLTAATVYVYDSKANAVTHNKVTGLLFKYSIAQTFVSGNRTVGKVLRET